MNMPNNKLCIILNIAPHYRKAIYQAIDNSFDCDWYAGDKVNDIKTLSPNEFKNCTIIQNKKIYKDNYIQKGLLLLLFDKRYKQFLITGDIRNITLWAFLLIAKLFWKKRIYTWTHGFNGKGGRLSNVLKKFFINLSDGVFLYGNFARNHMIASGIKPEKLFIIHNSLDYNKHIECRKQMCPTNIYKDHFGNNYKNLIFIGRLTSIKRLDLLIDAVRQLADKGCFYNVTFVGDGVERNILEQLVKKYNIHNQVWFYGESYDEQKNAELIYNADLCVSPGNVGLTAIHSLVFGTPVATHNNFKMQMPEFEAIKEGVTGTFFNYQDSTDLADSIDEWFSNFDDKRDIIRKNCMQEIDLNWTPQYQIDVLKNIIKN